LNLAVKVTLLAAGVFLFVGMIAGVLKYAGMMSNQQHRAPIYIDIAHRAALLYSFAALVMAALLYFSPYSLEFQLLITGAPLFFFALSIAQYLKLGIKNQETSQFRERNFSATWGMLLLVIGEIGGMGFILWGFISTQFLA